MDAVAAGNKSVWDHLMDLSTAFTEGRMRAAGYLDWREPGSEWII
jgi:hypothetical protein